MRIGEFVATGAHAMANARTVLRTVFSPSAESEVSLLVPEGVAHVLEAVDVERDDAAWLAVARRERVPEP